MNQHDHFTNEQIPHDDVQVNFSGGISEAITNFKHILTDSSIGDTERLILSFAFVFSGSFKFWASTLDKWLQCGEKKRRSALRNLENLGFAKMVYVRNIDGTIKHSYWKISLNKLETITSSETAISPNSVKRADIVVSNIVPRTDDNMNGFLAETGEIAVLDQNVEINSVKTDSSIVSTEVSEKSDKFETNKAHVVDSKKHQKHEPTVPLSLPVKPVDERSDGKVCKTTQNFDSGYLQVAIGNIPPQLKGWKQWVFWRGVKHDESDKKPTKIPFNATGAAKSNDRSTWLPFVAMQTWMQRKMDGIAFVLSDDDPFSMIDLDGCVENETINEFARKVIDYFDSYTELSPSGTGVRIFVEGKVDSAIKHPKVNDKTLPLEIYSRSRVATVTGHVIRNKPVCNRQEKLTKTYEAYKPKPKYLPAANGKQHDNGVFKMPTEPIPEGQRNNTLAKWAGVMKSKGLPEVEYFAYLHQINLTLCQPPLSDKEVDAIGRSLLRYA